MPKFPLKRVMYIEDEPDIRSIVQIALEKIGGVTVTTCGSVRETLGLALDFNPKLILLDIMMPDMDGFAVLQAIRSMPQLVNVPVVFVTAKTQLHEIDQYKEEGVSDVITKPFDPVALPKIVNDIWEKIYE